MRRLAIVISVPNAVGQNRLPGAQADGSHWYGFLQSDNAGAWTNQEVIHLQDPTRHMVDSFIQHASGFDYVLVAFSGHGDHKIEKSYRYDSVILGDGTEIKEHELIPRAKRVALILDACREVTDLRKFAKSFEKSAAMSFSESTLNYRRDCRNLFDLEISKCGEGLIKLKSCSINQFAQEDSAGGYFTNALIESCDEYAETNRHIANNSILTLKDAFDMASLVVSERNPTQNPSFEPGRATRMFPFLVMP